MVPGKGYAMRIVKEGSIGSVAAGDDIVPVTLADGTDFTGLGAGNYARGFFATADGVVRVTTAAGNVRDIPVVAQKDYLVKVKRFHSTGTTATTVWAF
jgi:hypothetical protein